MVGKKRGIIKIMARRATTPKRTMARTRNYFRKLAAARRVDALKKTHEQSHSQTADQAIASNRAYLKALRGKRARLLIKPLEKKAIESEINSALWQARLRNYSHLGKPLFGHFPFRTNNWLLEVIQFTKTASELNLKRGKKRIEHDIKQFKAQLNEPLKDSDRQWINDIIDEREAILAQVNARMNTIEIIKISENEKPHIVNLSNRLMEKIGENQTPIFSMTTPELEALSNRHQKLVMLAEKRLATYQHDGDQRAAEQVFQMLIELAIAQSKLMDEIKKRRTKQN